MYLVQAAHITFPSNSRRGEINIRRVNTCRVERSFESLINTALLVLPRNLKEFTNGQLRQLIRRSDRVIIRMGYGNDLKEEFRGYVTSVGSGIPVEITFEDDMWAYKQKPVNLQHKKVKLEELLREIMPGRTIRANDVTLGAERWEKTTTAKVLEKIKDDYGIYTYFQNGVVYSGDPFTFQQGRASFTMEENVRINTNNLKYVFAEDIRIRVVATSRKLNGDIVEAEAGDVDGQTVAKSFFNIESQDELQAIADREFRRLKYDGYRGEFSGYAKPFVDHNYIVDMKSYQYPERDGRFWASAVSVLYDDSGIKRTIKLERRA